MTTSQVTVFNPESRALTFTDKKGDLHEITPEGAMFKGGAAIMSALRDASMDSALSKAVNGRYRAAADILAACFSKAAKSAQNVIGPATPFHANKTTMGVLIAACHYATAPEKGWNKKQAEARILLGALMQLPAFSHAAEQIEVIENAAE